MSQFNIAVIPGDGIGTEVIPEGIKALQAAAAQQGIELNFTHFDWSCETYHKTGRMMPEDGLEQLSRFDAIFLGAVGFPGVPDHISLWGLLLPIRRAFNQYVNLRPVRLFEGLQSPLANKKPGDIDFYVVRENVEGEYSNIGGIQYEGTEDEVVSQQSIFTRKGTDRILKYAFDLAQSRDKKHLSSATKSNGLFHSMPYWDGRVEAMAEQYPEVKVDQFHIDIFTANLVRMPEFYDVIVGSNLFGDILSDLGPACTGTIAIAPSANINPEKTFPSMFEPVHGSAPDIAGQNIANPIGTVWAAAMMMQHLGCNAMHDTIMTAIETVIRDQTALTRDMSGNASTQELGQAIVDAIQAS
ncbi:tartrate dehydrogenase/decarboxylase/D-malate dehydrogenase [Marinobacterium halophilum]|uniref:D-malate dehydrogenase (decarboxylating) n=1 Tax=Marinobacterium halophilum TaxID=267374 RepID=A0A2P8F552_9GAMM|nr:tartrate dehydrogenase [Marinobacterium halophilum]PSL16831.1 tartrate dehydrogenase/decarboxylase/D-malate dehydrogenase [Marinobacterium halophilum]